MPEERQEAPPIEHKQGVELPQIDPELLPYVLSLNDEQGVPLRAEREGVSRVRALKLSEDELPIVQAFQDHLFIRKYIKENTFSALFIYVFSVAYRLHQQQAIEEAKKEAQS